MHAYEFLIACEPGTSTSRLARHLSRETVVGWLSAVSRCGLQQAVKVCIDFIVAQQLPVNFDTLCSLHRSDADQLLTAVHTAGENEKKRIDTHTKGLVSVASHCGGYELYRYKCCGTTWLTHKAGATMTCSSCGLRKDTSIGRINLALWCT